MSKPPNSPTLANSTSQHGITASSPSSTATTKASKPHNAVTVLCSNTKCPKTVDVVPFGYGMGLMRINVRCGGCQLPVLVVKGLGEYERKKLNEVGKVTERWDWPGGEEKSGMMEEIGRDMRRDSVVEGV
jgi:hypothetical protein